MDSIVVAGRSARRVSDGVFVASTQRDGIEFYQSLEPVWQASIVFALVVVIAAVVLGILPNYSTRTVKTAQRSPLISMIVGFPGALVLVTFLYLASLIADHSLGVFFAIPLVSVGVTLLPAWTALGIVVIGGAIATRLGFGGIAGAILVGATLAAMAAFVPDVLVGFGAVAASLGVGAGTRVLIGLGVSTQADERTIPPANNV